MHHVALVMSYSSP